MRGRPMECTGHDTAPQRVAISSWLRNVVRPDKHEGVDDGRDERRDRGVSAVFGRSRKIQSTQVGSISLDGDSQGPWFRNPLLLEPT